MRIEEDILETLANLGYTGPMLERKHLKTAVAGGPKSIDYTELISFLTNELRELCNIDECVNAIKSPEDSSSFLLELSSFLKELQCPFVNLTQGHVSDRLSTEYDKMVLINYLNGELMAARMVSINKPDQKMELKIHESSNANNLKQILLALKFNKPPPNITALMLFQKVEPKLQETVKRAGPDLLGDPIFNRVLTEKQWNKMSEVNDDLNADFTIRREMLLKRLDCTIQSFQWSDRVKGKEDTIAQIFQTKRKNMTVDPDIDVSDLLAARNDLAIIEKTSSASVRKCTQTKLNKHIIGPVPDRGGRPNEQQPPPPEMPSWQQRGPGGGGRGGGAGRGRGGSDNFSRGGGNDSFRGRGGDNYSRGGGMSATQSFDNRSSYDNRSNMYDNRSTHDNRRGSYDNKGSSYDNRSSGYDNRSSGYDNRGNNYDNRGGNYDNRGSSYDSRGSYDNRSSNYGGGYSDRGRSYDNYQVNKTTYAEQYVQESQQNQQYRGDNRGYDSSRGQQSRGRSSYSRGGYR